MKRTGTSTIFVLVCALVLAASYGIGLGIREIRFRHAAALANVQPKITPIAEKSQVSPAEQEQTPARARGRVRSNFSDEEETPEFGQGMPSRPTMREDFENMTEEERAQMRERFGRGRRGGSDRFANLSDEERAQMEEERRRRREQFENMSDEERSQMRERFGRGRRNSGGDGFGNDQQDN